MKQMMERHGREFRRAIENHKYELTEDGDVFMPSQKLFVGGFFVTSVNGGAAEAHKNLVPLEGRNHILDVLLHGAAQVSPWYVALFSGNVTPQPGWTGANFAANATEYTGYTESTRVAYDEGAASNGQTDNLNSEAGFT
ncbi:MAG: hypothetical protein ACREJT_10490, partial [Myxococcota bacterium]